MSKRIEIPASVTVCDFYKKMGFEMLGKRRNFYSFPEDDAIVMQLNKGGVKELN